MEQKSPVSDTPVSVANRIAWWWSLLGAARSKQRATRRSKHAQEEPGAARSSPKAPQERRKPTTMVSHIGAQFSEVWWPKWVPGAQDLALKGSTSSRPS